MSRLTELRDGVTYVAAELTQIHERAADRPLTADEQSAFDAGTEFVRTSRDEIAALEAREAQVAELRELAAANPQAVVPAVHPGFNVNRGADPFDLSTVRMDGSRDGELRARAIDVIEKRVPSYVTDDQREAATRLAEREGTRSFDAAAVRSHIVRTSSPAYVDAFNSYLRSPQLGAPAILSEHESRAAMSLTAANGGVLVPQFLDPTIVLTNTGANNAVRQISGNAKITVDQWDGVTSAGMTAEWLAEGSEAADASPTFVAPTITVHKAAAYAFASYEVLMDSGFDQFVAMVADAKDRLEETAFTTGSGSGQPYGLIKQLSGSGPSLAGSSGAAGAADLVFADLTALVAGLRPRFRRNGSFMANIAIWNQVRSLGNSANGTNLASYWVDALGDIPAALLGKPSYENEAMDSTIVSGSNDDIILFGDFNAGYKVVDRIGMEVAYNPLVVGSNQRPTGQAGWFAFWRVGADVITSSAFRLLRV